MYRLNGILRKSLFGKRQYTHVSLEDKPVFYYLAVDEFYLKSYT